MTKGIVNYHLSISKEKMEAFLELKKPGVELEGTEIEEIIKEIETKGIKTTDTLHQLRETIKASTGLEKITIANGVPPIDGTDGYIEILRKQKCDSKPIILEDGRADFYNLDLVTNVNKGDVLAKIHSPKDGTDGIDVLGEKVPFKQGKIIKPPVGKNIDFLVERKELVATISGQISLNNNQISVFEVLEVKNVDFKTGNIDFVGSVIINEAVTNGFTVKAGGDITVNGYVDSAFITCGGNLIVKGGIQGRNRGKVTANGNIIARYIENCEIRSGGSIIVRDSIMHSKAYAYEKIVVSEGKGLIVGGVVSAEKEIVANTIGSHLATVTELEVGVNPELREELQKLTKELTKGNEELKKAKQAQKLLKAKEVERGGLPPEHKAMLIRLNITINHLSKVVEGQKALQQEMLEKLLASSEGKVRANKTVYTGVKITIGTRYRNVTDTFKSPTFYIGSDGEVTVQ